MPRAKSTEQRIAEKAEQDAAAAAQAAADEQAASELEAAKEKMQSGERVVFKRTFRFALRGVEVIEFMSGGDGYDTGELDALDPEILEIARENDLLGE